MMKNISQLCGCQIEFEDFIMPTEEEIRNLIKDYNIDFVKEMYILELELEKNNEVLKKQNGAPVLNLNLKTKLTDIGPKSTTVNIEIDFSPMINFFEAGVLDKSIEKFKNIEDTYNAYCLQKKLLNNQINLLLSFYKDQLTLSENNCRDMEKKYNTYEIQYKNGAISKFDLEISKLDYENSILRESIAKKYCMKYLFILIMLT